MDSSTVNVVEISDNEYEATIGNDTYKINFELKKEISGLRAWSALTILIVTIGAFGYFGFSVLTEQMLRLSWATFTIAILIFLVPTLNSFGLDKMYEYLPDYIGKSKELIKAFFVLILAFGSLMYTGFAFDKKTKQSEEVSVIKADVLESKDELREKIEKELILKLDNQIGTRIETAISNRLIMFKKEECKLKGIEQAECHKYFLIEKPIVPDGNIEAPQAPAPIK